MGVYKHAWLTSACMWVHAYVCVRGHTCIKTQPNTSWRISLIPCAHLNKISLASGKHPQDQQLSPQKCLNHPTANKISGMQTRQWTLPAQKQQFCFMHPQNKIFHERYAQAAQKYNSKILSPLMLSGRKTKYVIHADKRILKSCGATATRAKTSLAAPVLEASEIFCNLETIFFNVPRYQSRNWLVNRS